jgi:predicted nucleotidyltransferase
MSLPVPDLVDAVRRALAPLTDIRVAYLFGSRIKGRPRSDSDLDLAVAFPRNMDEWSRELLRREVIDRLVDELGVLGESADIVELDRASSGVAFSALRDGVRVIERDREERVALESRIMSTYWDDEPRRAIFRQAAAVRAPRGPSNG